MTLESVVFQQDWLSGKDVHDLLGGNWGSSSEFLENQTENHHYKSWDNFPISSSPAINVIYESPHLDSSSTTPLLARPRRCRAKSRKNQQEIENQRITHIAVERNRRKQMNEHLSILRSLMPDSYIQRCDQASIIGGAINFVKELEQSLQQLKVKNENTIADSSSQPFPECFTSPQYSTISSTINGDNTTARSPSSTIADIEVTMVESHVKLIIRSRRRTKQLQKLVSGLECHRLIVLHLNVTTADQTVLYALSVKVEDGCTLKSADEIATFVHDMVARIQEESVAQGDRI